MCQPPGVRSSRCRLSCPTLQLQGRRRDELTALDFTRSTQTSFTALGAHATATVLNDVRLAQCE